LGIGLAFGDTHDRPRRLEDAFVAGFEFGDVVGILGDNVAAASSIAASLT